jgi:hypothetical protein
VKRKRLPPRWRDLGEVERSSLVFDVEVQLGSLVDAMAAALNEYVKERKVRGFPYRVTCVWTLQPADPNEPPIRIMSWDELLAAMERDQ